MTTTETVDPRAALPMLDREPQVSPPNLADREPQVSPPNLADRMEFRVSEEFKKRMEQIAQDEGCSLADLFRRAMGLYDLAYEQEKTGACMAFVRLPQNSLSPVEILQTFSL